MQFKERQRSVQRKDRKFSRPALRGWRKERDDFEREVKRDRLSSRREREPESTLDDDDDERRRQFSFHPQCLLRSQQQRQLAAAPPFPRCCSRGRRHAHPDTLAPRESLRKRRPTLLSMLAAKKHQATNECSPRRLRKGYRLREVRATFFSFQSH